MKFQKTNKSQIKNSKKQKTNIKFQFKKNMKYQFPVSAPSPSGRAGVG